MKVKKLVQDPLEINAEVPHHLDGDNSLNRFNGLGNGPVGVFPKPQAGQLPPIQIYGTAQERTPKPLGDVAYAGGATQRFNQDSHRLGISPCRLSMQPYLRQENRRIEPISPACRFALFYSLMDFEDPRLPQNAQQL
jgi:hypothetical protein